MHEQSIPLPVVCTSAALFLLAAVGLGLGGLAQPAFPFFCGITALVPFRGRTGANEWGGLLCYALAAWSAFGLAPLVTIGDALGGPYGGHPLLFAVGLLAAVLRLRAFASPAMKEWMRPR